MRPMLMEEPTQQMQEPRSQGKSHGNQCNCAWGGGHYVCVCAQCLAVYWIAWLGAMAKGHDMQCLMWATRCRCIPHLQHATYPKNVRMYVCMHAHFDAFNRTYGRPSANNARTGETNARASANNARANANNARPNEANARTTAPSGRNHAISIAFNAKSQSENQCNHYKTNRNRWGNQFKNQRVNQCRTSATNTISGRVQDFRWLDNGGTYVRTHARTHARTYVRTYAAHSLEFGHMCGWGQTPSNTVI